jgi:hypothetical protein
MGDPQGSSSKVWGWNDRGFESDRGVGRSDGGGVRGTSVGAKRVAAAERHVVEIAHVAIPYLTLLELTRRLSVFVSSSIKAPSSSTNPVKF